MTGKLKCLALAGGFAILFWFPSARAEQSCVGKIQDKCTTCHYPTRICDQIGHKSWRDWETTINRMRRYGLQLSEDLEDKLIDCLQGLEEKDRDELCR